MFSGRHPPSGSPKKRHGASAGSAAVVAPGGSFALVRTTIILSFFLPSATAWIGLSPDENPP